MAKKAKTPVAKVETVEVKAAAAAVETPAVEEKAPAKKAAKVEKKTATRKTTAKVKTTVTLQFNGQERTEADLVEQAKQLWAESGKTEAVKELNLYVKPEDGAVYCVINGEPMGSFAL